MKFFCLVSVMINVLMVSGMDGEERLTLQPVCDFSHAVDYTQTMRSIKSEFPNPLYVTLYFCMNESDENPYTTAYVPFSEYVSLQNLQQMKDFRPFLNNERYKTVGFDWEEFGVRKIVLSSEICGPIMQVETLQSGGTIFSTL